jgi:hypothetical protein
MESGKLIGELGCCPKTKVIGELAVCGTDEDHYLAGETLVPASK